MYEEQEQVQVHFLCSSEGETEQRSNIAILDCSSHSYSFSGFLRLNPVAN